MSKNCKNPTGSLCAFVVFTESPAEMVEYEFLLAARNGKRKLLCIRSNVVVCSSYL
jgi:hypothetical protein